MPPVVRPIPTDRSHLLPFAGATDLHLRIAGSFGVLTDWSAALKGQFDLSDVLQILTRQREAHSIVLFRLFRNSALPIAAATRLADKAPPPRSSGALLRYLRDTQPDALEPGTVWSLSDMRKDPAFGASSAAREWRLRPEILEVATVILQTDGDVIDALEIVFDAVPAPCAEIPPILMYSALAYAWSLRSSGLITRLTRTRSRTTAALTSEHGILGQGNPRGLSRAEQRVCQMLASGDKAKDIADVLGVSIATVRTHLRNIYAKTETSGQIELVAVINAEKGSGA